MPLIKFKQFQQSKKNPKEINFRSTNLHYAKETSQTILTTIFLLLRLYEDFFAVENWLLADLKLSVSFTDCNSYDFAVSDSSALHDHSASCRMDNGICCTLRLLKRRSEAQTADRLALVRISVYPFHSTLWLIGQVRVNQAKWLCNEWISAQNENSSTKC